MTERASGSGTRRFFVRLFAGVGIVTVLVVFLFLAISLLTLMPERVPSVTVVELDLEQAVVEYVPDEPFVTALEGHKLRVRDVVEGIERAAGDDRVRALLVRVGGGGLGMARVEEIRDAVLRFRESGKPAILFSETFGELGPGHGGYYLATAFDEILLQPSGMLPLTGMAAEGPFFRGTLDRLGIEPRLDHREEHKDALYPFTEERYPEPQREVLTAILESMYGELVEAVAGARDMAMEEVRDLMDRGPYVADEALELGFVDRLAYRDEVSGELEDRFGPDTEFLDFSDYFKRAGPAWTGNRTVAVIYGTGPVVRGSSGLDPLFGVTMGAESVAEAFRSAVEDDRVEAILFRVDSPGGSYVASDVIWRETLKAREAGKPVVVSMGNLAGSGGYLVSAGADRIVAHPSTITGSIGVVAGKMVTREFWEHLGVTWDVVEVGDNTGFYSAVRDYSPAEWERLQHVLDDIYLAFKEKVAEGRGMSLEEVEEVAKGRIWTGRQALELGLVDDLGGFETALRAVREEAGIDPDEEIRLIQFPPDRTLLEMMLGFRGVRTQESLTGQISRLASETLAPVIRLARAVAGPDAAGPVTTPLPPGLVPESGRE